MVHGGNVLRPPVLHGHVRDEDRVTIPECGQARPLIEPVLELIHTLGAQIAARRRRRLLAPHQGDGAGDLQPGRGKIRSSRCRKFPKEFLHMSAAQHHIVQMPVDCFPG